MKRFLVGLSLLLAPLVAGQSVAFKETAEKKVGDFGSSSFGIRRDAPHCDTTETYCPLQLDANGRVFTDVGLGLHLKNDSYSTGTSKGMLAMFRTTGGRPSPGTCAANAYCPGTADTFGQLRVMANQVPPVSLGTGTIDAADDVVSVDGISPLQFVTLMLDASIVPGGFNGDLFISTAGFNGIVHPAWIYDSNGVLVASDGNLNYSTDQFNDYVIFAPPGTESFAVRGVTVNSGSVQVNISRTFDASPFVMRGPGWEVLDDISANLGFVAQESTTAKESGGNLDKLGAATPLLNSVAVPTRGVALALYDTSAGSVQPLVTSNGRVPVYDTDLNVSASEIADAVAVPTSPTPNSAMLIMGTDGSAGQAIKTNSSGNPEVVFAAPQHTIVDSGTVNANVLQLIDSTANATLGALNDAVVWVITGHQGMSFVTLGNLNGSITFEAGLAGVYNPIGVVLDDGTYSTSPVAVTGTPAAFSLFVPGGYNTVRAKVTTYNSGSGDSYLMATTNPARFAVQPVKITGTTTVTGAGGTFPVTGTFWQTTQPVSGTFWQTTQPVSIASMPSTPVTGTFWPTTAAAPSAARISADGTNFVSNTNPLSIAGATVSSANTPGSCVSVTTGSTTLLASFSTRKTAVISNQCNNVTCNAEVVYYTLSATATTSSFPLAVGESRSFTGYTGAIAAISPTTTNSVCVQEF